MRAALPGLLCMAACITSANALSVATGINAPAPALTGRY